MFGSPNETPNRAAGANGGTANDGVYDNGLEQPIPGVVLSLLDNSGNVITDAAGNAITTTTDTNGRYQFTGLNPGNYRVEVISGNFANGQPLAGLLSSDGAGIPNSDLDEDIDENIINVCRCATYYRMRKAIHRAAELHEEVEPSTETRTA